MSQGSSPPSPSWIHLITLIVAFVGGLGTHSLITQPPAPVPVPPVPTPIVVPDTTPIEPVVVPPHIDPAPQPQPTPPTPVPSPPAPISYPSPVAAITVKDSEGNTVTTATPGQQLIFSSENAVYGKGKSSLIWNTWPKMQETVTEGGAKIIITVPLDFKSLKVQQIVGLGDQVATSSVTIESSKPVPAPSPSPSPAPQPSIIPVPQSQLTIGIVDDINQRPPAVAKLIRNEHLWEKYRQAGNRIYIWKAGDKPSPEPAAAADIAAVVGAKLPTGSSGIVIRNRSNDVVYIGVLPPDEAALDALLGPFTGVK